VIDVRNYVNGTWVASKGEVFHSFNPANGGLLSRAPITPADEVGYAVAAAKAAFENREWRESSGGERATALLKLADALASRRHEVADLITKEMGKPLRISLSREVDGAVDKLRFFAGCARLLDGQVTGATKPELLDMTLPEPVGVCGLIIPWNDPVDLAVRKIGAALAAGCTAVVKSSEITPASTAILFEVLHEANCLPAGVLNLVHGPGDPTGEALVAHPDVAKISFTGSTATGMRIMSQAAKRLARVSLECGGKLPALVFADADLERCLDAVTYGAFMYTGQSCTACTRLIVDRTLYARVLDGMVTRSRTLRVGDPLDPDVLVGPMASRAQFDKVAAYVDLGLAEGAEAVIGGKPNARSLYIDPTILTGDLADSRIAREEVFGPVLLVQPFDTEDQALAMANGTPFGLGGSVWTTNINRALRVVRKLDVADVWVNTHYVRNSETPYGGRHMSGLGRELGMAGVEEYVSWKRVCIDTRDTYHLKAWFEQPAADHP
jgi:acyl-CoA reductase-like NAD-dependent aldehyde dehydrogenase